MNYFFGYNNIRYSIVCFKHGEQTPQMKYKFYIILSRNPSFIVHIFPVHSKCISFIVSRSSPKIDWGLHQMDSVMDRSEITGSHFLVLITFGDHALHHLFPTIDHGRLNYLYPIFQNVCTEFGIEIKMSTQIDLTVGQFQQLSKMEPTKRRINI